MAQRKIDRQQLGVLVPKEIHDQLKEIAVRRNCTVTMIVIQAIMKRIREEESYE